MKFLTKSLLGAGAAAAALVTVAAPAQAQRYERYDRNRDGISAGEVIAGAVILGGLAAVLSGGNDRYNDGRYDNRDYDRGGYDNRGYNNGNGSRRAVNQCVTTVENWANGYSRSNVTQITNIDRTRGGYRVTGKLVVQDGWRGNNRGYGNDRYDRDDRYERGDRNGYGNQGYGNNQGYGRGYDKGRFTCYVERGRVIDVDYRGLEQWR